MHDDHHHHHDHGDGHHHHHHPHVIGHNGPVGTPLQWQTPHLAQDHYHEPPTDTTAQDIDLVESAFIEGFSRAPDAVSFLRLAGIPFVGETVEGKRLHLLRVEIEDLVDVGSVMPLLGGDGVRYDPLPTRLTSHRRRLSFIYHDGAEQRRLGFAAARALADRSAASQFVLSNR